MKRDKYLAKFHKKWERVAKMRESGKTFEQIAQKLGCTRQWASKMYQNWQKSNTDLMGEES